MMIQYHIVYGIMRGTTTYYKKRALDDYHLYSSEVLPAVKIIEKPIYYEGGSTISYLYDSENLDRIIPANERNDGIIFKKDLQISVVGGTKDGIYYDNFYNLISCISGRIYLSVINILNPTPNVDNFDDFILTSENGIQVLVPPFYGFSFYSFTDSIIIDKMAYKSYDTVKQQKLNIDTHNINWPI
jgi:dTDP-4-dehydrorhamnose 3,5-epimerase-like enzyme